MCDTVAGDSIKPDIQVSMDIMQYRFPLESAGLSCVVVHKRYGLERAVEMKGSEASIGIHEEINIFLGSINMEVDPLNGNPKVAINYQSHLWVNGEHKWSSVEMPMAFPPSAVVALKKLPFYKSHLEGVI
jgi:hypothetical protein